MEKFRKIAKILHISEPQDKSISTEELFFTHKTPFYTGSLSNMVESEGTNRMYGLSALLFTLIKNNQTLLCDELDNSLHYDLFTHVRKTSRIERSLVGEEQFFCRYALILRFRDM